MSSLSSAASLATSNDFASELALNRVMNGQTVPESGRGLNAASRALASGLDATALGYGVVAANVASARTLVEGAQDAITELVSQVRHLGDLCAGASSDAMAQSLAASVKQNIDALLQTEVQGVKVLGNSGRVVSLGLGNSDSMTVGQADINRSGSKFAALYNALTGGLTRASAQGLCEDAVHELTAAIGTQGTQYRILSNRYDMLNDLIGTCHMASDSQSVTTAASPSPSLLNAFL
ncbi:MAG: hypothetical protein J5861_00425 [Desulfovibrio sp.]|nr:hypothetical protein [Desulfovibrio sp.]